MNNDTQFMKYKDILSDEIKKQPDTDTGILKAYWETVERLINLNDKRQAIAFLQYVKKVWGETKYEQMKGYFIDANVLS